MSSITMTRGTRRLGRFIPSGETLEVGSDISATLANDLVEAGRATWGETPVSSPKVVETQDAPPLKTRARKAPKASGGRTTRAKSTAKK